MKIIQTPLTISIFGDSNLSVTPEVFRNTLSNKIIDQHPFNNVKNSTFALLKQTHEDQGICIATLEQAQKLPLFVYEGDFLVTQVKNIALGIVTADCLPIIVIDPIHKAIGIAHAGWRGSAANIAGKLITTLEKKYTSDPKDLLVQLGPCARPCCYQVQPSFLKNLQDISLYPDYIGTIASKTYLVSKEGNIHFDLPEFNRQLLMEAGIEEKNIDIQAQECTICNKNYISVRREKTEERQLSFVSLK